MDIRHPSNENNIYFDRLARLDRADCNGRLHSRHGELNEGGVKLRIVDDSRRQRPYIIAHSGTRSVLQAEIYPRPVDEVSEDGLQVSIFLFDISASRNQQRKFRFTFFDGSGAKLFFDMYNSCGLTRPSFTGFDFDAVREGRHLHDGDSGSDGDGGDDGDDGDDGDHHVITGLVEGGSGEEEGNDQNDIILELLEVDNFGESQDIFRLQQLDPF